MGNAAGVRRDFMGLERRRMTAAKLLEQGVSQSNYLYHHQRRTRINITGLHDFIRKQVAAFEGIDERYCQIVDAHYFRGPFSAREAQSRNQLYGERLFDDVLVREGVTTHYLPISTEKETGIDVWFALEAFEQAIYKRFNICVLIACDGDYVPLARKLNTVGARVWCSVGISNTSTIRVRNGRHERHNGCWARSLIPFS
jgi:hypothetical protein